MTKLLTPTGAMRAWVSNIVLLLTIGALVGFTIAYTTAQSRKICGLIVLIDDRNQDLPPAPDKDTADFRAELHRYRQALGC